MSGGGGGIHVRESKEFHALDSAFKVLDSGPFVRETWIPDSRIPWALFRIPKPLYEEREIAELGAFQEMLSADL